jgi:hypothetical protein
MAFSLHNWEGVLAAHRRAIPDPEIVARTVAARIAPVSGPW